MIGNPNNATRERFRRAQAEAEAAEVWLKVYLALRLARLATA